MYELSLYLYVYMYALFTVSICIYLRNVTCISRIMNTSGQMSIQMIPFGKWSCTLKLYGRFSLNDSFDGIQISPRYVNQAPGHTLNNKDKRTIDSLSDSLSLSKYFIVHRNVFARVQIRFHKIVTLTIGIAHRRTVTDSRNKLLLYGVAKSNSAVILSGRHTGNVGQMPHTLCSQTINDTSMLIKLIFEVHRSIICQGNR